MRIGLYGGSFDPVHYGHLLLAELTREKSKLDRVIFIPSGIPPHKTVPRASGRDRLAMLKRAIRGNPRLEVSDWEIRRKRAVYSIETASHFRACWPKAQLYFLVGSDALKTLPRWHQSQQLRKLCRFVGIDRIPAFSSTEVRRRVARRQSIRYHVPDTVEKYIKDHDLYR